MAGVYKPKEDALLAIFGRKKVVIGVIHMRPLPGSAEYDGEPVEDIYQAALQDALSYRNGGVDGLILENHGDIPFAKPDEIGPETSAVMAVAARKIRETVGLPMGINVLANAAIPALAVAHAAGCAFIRVNQWANAYIANEGLVEGAAARATRYRACIGARAVRVFADAHVKHGSHAIVADRSVPELARDVEFFAADAVIATGQRTGDAPVIEEIQAIRSGTQLPVLVGSGVDEVNVAEILPLVDGIIIASALKEEGVWWNPVSEARVRRFMEIVRASRGG
jgi:membrane complex biogenesis BtpA family protein